MADWQTLLSSYRIGQAAQPEASVRSEFQRDGDRLLFSASFRRMQDKTQVFPLEKNDYVRTRLTHSLEVSCVGRSLGSSVGVELLKRYPALKDQGIQPADIGDIVAAACLAHDIGNPPFGHFGEQAMRDFFTSDSGQSILELLDHADERADLTAIEGNAQGFRICNRLESPDTRGGLRLTAATLAAASKYPCTAAAQKAANMKKNGCYQDDLADFSDIFNHLGLAQRSEQAWQRHPLSFLMEAADDICYLIVDIEDAYQVGQIDHHTALSKLQALGGELVDPARFAHMRSKSDQLSYLRAKAIGKLVHETVKVFWESEQGLLDGSHHEPLLKAIPSIKQLEALRTYAREHIYVSRPVVEVQIAGHRVLSGLMDIFCSATANLAQNNPHSKRHDEMILALLPHRYRREQGTLYQNLLGACDYISGMTDSYAVSLYKKLTGISLPVN
ncbi:deoxyguanosinetriphosphate triphosphohydrolase [Suttonella sp. R2A3]|uniref:deoxyguanosinetriphosphate triphosphohydrolase n=1 Tax=Suttonella sp. R2A3 TaxID=2908648 RepID=UPI001F3D420F|nr:deoxyguanosinetriphosphate triphosphohydrolase [Suttonella sp. R2A3]UJF25040.1 deoxyguanosinetriphosphate triphosphohydrolase [Suttonella sp. R2A3]